MQNPHVHLRTPGSTTHLVGPSQGRGRGVAGAMGHTQVLGRLAFALGANLLERGAGTWAGDMLSPDGRQVGTSGPWF